MGAAHNPLRHIREPEDMQTMRSMIVRFLPTFTLDEALYRLSVSGSGRGLESGPLTTSDISGAPMFARAAR